METIKKGLIPVMITPFKGNGEIDYNTLTELTNLYIEAGAVGLFANCLSSEMFELNPQERIQITKHIIKVVDNRVPVVATGTFEGSMQEKADNIKQIYDTGVEAVIVITGLLADKAESSTIFDEKVYQLLDLTETIPLGFYECPVPYKRILSAHQLGEYIKTGRIIYHKDTCLDIIQIKEKVSVCKDYHFGLYDAYMGHAVESLKAGATGLSCIQGNYFPELIVWLCNNYHDANLNNEVNEVQQFFIDNMVVMHDVYPIAAKYFLKISGFDINLNCRINTEVFTKVHKHKLDQLYKHYQEIRQKLEIESLLNLK